MHAIDELAECRAHAVTVQPVLHVHAMLQVPPLHVAAALHVYKQRRADHPLHLSLLSVKHWHRIDDN
jgi:hypothetical protein